MINSETIKWFFALGFIIIMLLFAVFLAVGLANSDWDTPECWKHNHNLDHKSCAAQPYEED